MGFFRRCTACVDSTSCDRRYRLSVSPAPTFQYRCLRTPRPITDGMSAFAMKMRALWHGGAIRTSGGKLGLATR